MRLVTRSVWSRALAAVLVGPGLWRRLQATFATRAWAQEAPGEPPPQDFTPADTEAPVEDLAPVDLPSAADMSTVDAEQLQQIGEHVDDILPGDDAVEYTAPSPSGAGDKSAATPQAISLPKAEGSLQGMGD